GRPGGREEGAVEGPLGGGRAERAEGEAPLMHEREVEREEQRGPRQDVPDAEPTPEERRENDRDELDPDGERKGECCGRTPPARQCPRRGDEGERAEEIDAAVARASVGDERVARVREAPPGAPPRGR